MNLLPMDVLMYVCKYMGECIYVNVCVSGRVNVCVRGWIDKLMYKLMNEFIDE